MAQSSSATVITEHFKGTRITIHSDLNFPSLMNRLYDEIGHRNSSKFLNIAKGIKSYDQENKQIFIDGVEDAIGKYGFMIFQEFDHGAWLPLFNLSGLGLKRIILGNPLIARTMLEHDPLAGLSVPVELLVRERSALEGGGTDLMYHLPSSLIAGVYFWEGSGGVGKTKLMDASEALDDKLRALVEFIAQTPE